MSSQIGSMKEGLSHGTCTASHSHPVPWHRTQMGSHVWPVCLCAQDLKGACSADPTLSFPRQRIKYMNFYNARHRARLRHRVESLAGGHSPSPLDNSRFSVPNRCPAYGRLLRRQDASSLSKFQPRFVNEKARPNHETDPLGTQDG